MQTMRIFSKKRITLLFILVFMTVNLSLWAAQLSQKKTTVPTLSATVLPVARDLEPFNLKDGDNHAFNQQNLIGHWTFMYFGFTRCNTICPMNMKTLNDIYTTLRAEKQKKMPQVVFVSIDPDRDTAADIQRYVTAFNPSFQGATGAHEQLAKLSQQLSVLYMKVDATPTEKQAQQDYQIDHSGTFLLLDPAGKLRAVFSMPHDASKIAKDYATITKHYS